MVKTDGTKKAHGVCNGSSQGGTVRVLDHTYASCVEQTGSCLFYSICAQENLCVFGANASNAFAEAFPPKQGFYVWVDNVFQHWWTRCLNRPPIPEGFVIPVRHALQGHPESPQLWERHIKQILCSLGLQPTHHEPCLYRGTIDGKTVLFLCQVDDFTVGAAKQCTANRLLEQIDVQLTEPLKRQGLVSHFNGWDVNQTRKYVKISVQTYLKRVLADHGWGKTGHTPHSLPMSPDSAYLRRLDEVKGPADEKGWKALKVEMRFGYQKAIRELIWAMVTCRLDILFVAVTLSQHSANPAREHYVAVRHVFWYL